MTERQRCRVVGCENVVMLKGRGEGGKALYRLECQRHHRLGKTKRAKTDGECAVCGWKGEVHRHRLDPPGRHAWENIRLLCPNCHAHEHGRGELNLRVRGEGGSG